MGRLAPSPTGNLHLGHAFAFLEAEQRCLAGGGHLRLRWDDLDPSRCRPEFEESILRDLEWLGIDWVGPPQRASDFLEACWEAIEALACRGQAYACTCTRRDILSEVGAPHPGEELRYPGTCRGRKHPGGRQDAWRLCVPDRVLSGVDAIQGPWSLHPAREVGDFLLWTRAGVPSYQLATVVADAALGVTEVVRGLDLLPSQARQDLLREFLGFPTVRGAHVPLVLNASGERLAKRSPEWTLAHLREEGFQAHQIRYWARSRPPESSSGQAPEVEMLVDAP